MKLLLAILLSAALCIDAIRLPQDAGSQSVQHTSTAGDAQWRYDVESSSPLPDATQDKPSLPEHLEGQPVDEDELDSAAAGSSHERHSSGSAAPAPAEHSTVRHVLQAAGRSGRQLLQLLLNNVSPIRVQGVTTFANGPAAAGRAGSFTNRHQPSCWPSMQLTWMPLQHVAHASVGH